MSDCLFCSLGPGGPGGGLWEDDRVLAVRDINPEAPVHVLVVPREHHATLGALATSGLGLLGRVVTAAHTLAGQEGPDRRRRRKIPLVADGEHRSRRRSGGRARASARARVASRLLATRGTAARSA